MTECVDAGLGDVSASLQGGILRIDCTSQDLIEELCDIHNLPAYRFRNLVYDARPDIGHERASNSSPLTIAFQYFRYGFGGAEKVTHELMVLFVEMGYRVLLYTDEPASEGDYPVPEGVVRKRVEAGYSEHAERVGFWHTEVATEHIALVLYNSWCSPAALLDCLAIQSAGAAFLFHAHSNAPYFMQIDDLPLVGRLEAIAYIADGVVGLSEADRVFWSAYSNNVSVVVNPIDRYMHDVSVRTDIPQGHLVLWCGRIAVEKRPEEAITIMRLLLDEMPDARLDFVGEGDEELTKSLKAQAEAQGVSHAIRFLGFQDDTIPFYQKANVLLLTSVVEGFPLTLSEAMQQGIPAVSYELPYLPLMKGEGVTQVSQLDAEAAARALAAILRDPMRQRRMGQAARRTYEEVCCVDFKAMWHDVIEKTLDRTPRSEDARSCADEGCTSAVRELVRACAYEYGTSYARRWTDGNMKDERIRELEDKCACLEREKRDVQQELDDQLASKTYRAGRAVTALPRAIRSTFGHD